MTQLNKQMLNKKKGFTLTELAIVIAVIAILVAVLVPTFTSILSKAKESAALQNSTNAITYYAIEDEEVAVPEYSVVYDGSGDAIYAYVGGGLHEITVYSDSGLASTNAISGTLTDGTTYYYSYTVDSTATTYTFAATMTENSAQANYYGTAYIWEATEYTTGG